eukprot:COSAG02_NODE_4195_length_5642_cov_16.342053_4_plen_75_part_00
MLAMALLLHGGLLGGMGGEDTQGIRPPYALCVMLFNMFRRLILGAYCVVNRGILAHNEGILSLSVCFTRHATPF